MALHCIGCGGRLASLGQPYRYGKGTFRNRFPGLELFRCMDCGLKQVDHDAISVTELEQYYSAAYRVGERRANKVDPTNVKFLARGKAFSRLALRYVEDINAVSSIFELGGGLGYNLIALKEEFPNAKLFTDEPDETVALPRSVDRAKIEPDAFDIVLLSHVLEHLAHPRAMCARLSAALRPGGLMIIEVPNDTEGFLNSKSEDQPHLTFFEGATLRKFFARNFPSLEILKVSTGGVRSAPGASDKRVGRGEAAASERNRRKRSISAYPMLQKLYAPVRRLRVWRNVMRETRQLLDESDNDDRIQLRLIAKRSTYE